MSRSRAVPPGRLATDSPAARWRRLAAATALAALGVLAACGGGGSSDAASTTAGTSTGTTTGTSTGSTSGTSTGTGTTGTTTTAAAYTAGTVTGFGSIIVNGIRFDDSSVTATDDSGNPGTVKLGMRVEVQSASVDSGTSTAKATAVRFGSRVLGPVEVAGVSGGSTATVLGQVLDITEATVFDSTLSAGISALTLGTVVEVHGLTDSATGHLLATRIEAKTSATAYKLAGTVSALDSTAKTFRIGSAVINYASATDVPSTLANGSSVRVWLATAANASGQWVASSFGSSARSTVTSTAAHVRGTITAYTSSTAFTVDGIPVDASAVTSLPSGLALGVEVDVTGTLTNGTLVASAVTLKTETRGHDSQRYELHGTISALDTTAKTFVLRGITVSYGSATYPSGGSEAGLVNGVRVEVKGTVGATRSQLTATTIRFESSSGTSTSTSTTS